MQPDMSVWQGRVDADEGPLAVRWHQRVQPYQTDAAPGIVLLGFACDEGVRRNQGRVGAAQGPRALRAALANLAWHHSTEILDFGDIECTDADLALAQDRLADAVASLVQKGHSPLILGGGHETALGTFRGAASAREKSVFGIVNLDAHFDLRTNPQATSGTPFAQIARWCEESARPFRYFCLGIAECANTLALFEKATRLGVAWRCDRDLSPWHLEEPLAALDQFVSAVDYLYVSIDLDVLPAAVMPAVSAPAALGVPLESVDAILAQLLATDKIAAVDVVEFNPSLDTDGRAARVAARIVWQIARNWARAARAT